MPYRAVEHFTLVIPAGVEPAIFWMRTRRPGPLDDGTSSKSGLFAHNETSFIVSPFALPSPLRPQYSLRRTSDVKGAKHKLLYQNRGDVSSLVNMRGGILLRMSLLLWSDEYYNHT